MPMPAMWLRAAAGDLLKSPRGKWAGAARSIRK